MDTVKPQKNHYTYMITELDTGRMYIGVRSTSTKPEYDLGVEYFSSSLDSDFIFKQKHNPSNYKYEILSIFNTRLEAINHEIELHEIYDVCDSDNFINFSNSKSSNFDMHGKVVVRDENGDTMVVSTDDPRYLSGELQHHSKGYVDRELVSKNMKTTWSDDYDYMKEKIHNPESNALRGQAQSEWIKNNPEAHKERMDKINKNPEKIAKMAEKHRGMKRSDETCANISEAKKANFANKTKEERDAITGKGGRYITDTTTYISRRVAADYILKENEIEGVAKNPKEPFKKRAVVTNIVTWTEYWCEVGHVLKDNERKGNKKAVKKKMRELGEIV